jgi:hypothetical protein
MWRLKRVSEEGWVGFENFIRQYRDLHGTLGRYRYHWIVWGGWESRLMCSEWPTYGMTGSGHSMRQASQGGKRLWGDEWEVGDKELNGRWVRFGASRRGS